MVNLKKDVHDTALAEIRKRFSLTPVQLKYPFPERPLRTLGLVKVDGNIYSSEKFARVVLLKVSLPVYVTVRSTFIRPRLEYDLPVFSSEVIIMGKKRMVIVDIHRTGESTGHDDTALFDRLEQIREQYPALREHAIQEKSEIRNVYSRAVCQVKISEALDEQAFSLFREYLTVFMEIMEKAEPLSGEILENARDAYKNYLKTIVDHDPGMQFYKILFGKTSGVERSMNMHFEQ